MTKIWYIGKLAFKTVDQRHPPSKG